MSGIISFSGRPEEMILINNVTFRAVLEALAHRMPETPDVSRTLWVAEGVKALMIDDMEPGLARMFVDGLRGLSNDLSQGLAPEDLASIGSDLPELAELLGRVEHRYK